MAVYDCVGLCRAMLGYVGLCKGIERNVFHILANGEPLYDAYTTYLPNKGFGGLGAQSPGLIKPGLGHCYLRIFSRVRVSRRRGS